MKKFRLIISIPLILVIALISAAGIISAPVLAHNGNPHLVKTFIGEEGQQIDQLVFPGKPPTVKEKSVTVPKANVQAGVNSVASSVPAFYWSYGCSATSAAMLFGYYDLNGYANMYTGPANSGNCPLTNFIWGTTSYASVTCGECPLSATHAGVDSLTANGHVDDYWIDYNNAGPDPYIVGSWTEHTSTDCTGDFMGTNQSKWHNSDGSTTFYFYTNGDPLVDYSGSEATGYRDGGHGMKLFAQSRGYTVTTTFNQYIKGQGTNPLKGFTFANYMAEIDAGRPVLIQVSGHTMLGYGYNTTGNTVYLHDTWDYSEHQMTWGGKYAGMQHYGVTVFRLTASGAPTAAFSGSPTAGTAPLTVSFTDASTGTAPLTYAWDFNNDGSVDSTLQSPSYTYTSAGTYSVKLTVTNTAGSDAELKTNYITVNSASAGLITVISPNGGESWKSNTSKTITWTSSNVTGNVKIDLSRNGGSTWTAISAGTANDGSYTWRVTRPATSQARIRVSSVTNTSVYDISNANFTIK